MILIQAISNISKQVCKHKISLSPSLFLSAKKRGYRRTDGPTDGPTDRRTDGPTDGPTDGHTLL